MEWIRPDEQGARLSVRAVPRAARNEIQGVHGGALKIRLQAPPVEGRANQALIAFLGERLGVPRSRLALVHGETGRDKTVCIAGLTPAQVQERLQP